MTIKYRGFNIQIRKSNQVVCITDDKQVGRCEGYYCGVFSIESDISDKALMAFSLALGKDIEDMDEITLTRSVCKFIDDNHNRLDEYVNFLKCERKNYIINQFAELQSCRQSQKALYELLHDTIKMSDKEIQEAGLLSLVPFFDRDNYAQEIVDFMVTDGTSSTGTCDYGYTYEEIDELFGIDLRLDTDMKDLIFEKINNSYSAHISSIKEESSGIVINFRIWCCPGPKEDAGFDGLDKGSDNSFGMSM